MSELVIRALGTPSIEYKGDPIKVDTRKATALLVFLAVEAQPRSRDGIAALLWPEHDQSRARAALRRTLSVLHKALDGQYLAIERERLSLTGPTPPWVDVLEFRRALASRRTHAHTEKEVCPACLEPLRQAVALYDDDFLSGFALRDSVTFDEWQFAQRQALRDELDIALAALTRGYILVGELTEAITSGRRWLSLDPLNEQAHRFLMRLYDWTGQRAASVRQYRECVQTLERELGAAPLDVTTRLYEAIRAQRAPGPPEPVAREQVAGERPSLAEDREGDARGAQGAQAAQMAQVTQVARTAQVDAPAQPKPAVTVSATLTQTTATPLLGRAADWSAALDAYQSSAHAGRLLVIEGEAGIGKTRLANELIAHARGQGSVVGVARCYEGEAALAYSAMAALLRSIAGQEPGERLRNLPDIWLSEATRLAPELAAIHPGLAAPAPLDTLGAQSRFYEGLRETLIAACATGAPPGLLVLDDAQWADDASLDALTYLLRRVERQPLCVTLTWRTDSVDGQHRLRRLLGEIQRRGRAIHLSLQRLDEAAVMAWLRYGLGADRALRTPDLAQRLYQETEGLPFFISEYVLALTSGAVPAESSTWTAPVGVHDLLRSRLRTLSETGWQSLTTAAVLGRSFDFDTVREVSGRSEEETAAALEELLARGLIRETLDTHPGEINYDFTHDKLRSLVYEETSLARRRLLHRRAAEALVELSRRKRQGAERAAQIAQHYAAAGDDGSAATQHAIAGARARELYAHGDAIHHFERALTLGYPNAAELHEAIGDAYTLLGEYPQALSSYELAAAMSKSSALGRIEYKIGGVHGRRGEWEAAQSRYQSAVEALASESLAMDALAQQARIYADWSLAARHLGQVDLARRYAERALELASSASDMHALAQAHNILGALANSEGDTERALRHLEDSLALAERLDDASARAAALNNLALALQAAGQNERALPLAEAALALCVTQGDRHHEAALHNNVADLLHAAGHVEDAMAHLKQSVSIYAEIGVEAGAVQPGIWNMVDW
ncbi:MAG TPA: AAA family ATPase [Ktedonobacterales bacterium]